jgi:CheY-like chemotaxis protein
MKTILVVDDEYALVETLTDLLEQEGYAVVSAANGKDGLLRATEVAPDLVLTDFMMAISDGAELARAVRAVPGLEKVPVVMMSATARSVALAAAKGEVSQFVKKPFSWKQLREVVVSFIGEGDGS